jgi:Rhodopirellula transposase DDE domain
MSLELLITADGEESLGVRNKLWKKALQTLANQEQLTITVAHDPPATVPRGTRSNTATFPSFPLIGVPNHSPLWKPLLN